MKEFQRGNCRREFQEGFTLLEVVLSMVLASGILTAIILLHAPLINAFSQAFNFQKLRLQVSSPLEFLQKEIAGAKVAYVDATQCYSLCLIDRATGNRIYYYWSGNDLYRKSETTSNAVACSGGKPFARGLDKTGSSFKIAQNLLDISLKQSGTNNSSYLLTTSLFPTFSERQTLFYDGFNCNSSTSQGWILTPVSYASWFVEKNTGAGGSYWLKEKLTQDTSTALTASAEIPIRLSRIKSAHMQFKYRTVGTMNPGEIFTANFYDGSWHEIFRDDLLGQTASLSTVSIDLTPYTLNDSNRLRFDGSLLRTNDYWVIDEIEIFAN